MQVSAVSIFFESLPYRVDETTGLIDYDMLDKCVRPPGRPQPFPLCSDPVLAPTYAGLPPSTAPSSSSAEHPPTRASSTSSACARPPMRRVRS